MSRKFANFDDLLTRLRAEAPTPEMTERARLSVMRESGRPSDRPRSLGKPIALALAGLAIAIVFWPRQEAGSAWGQTVQNTLGAPFMIRTMKYADGRIGLKEWTSGVRRAVLLYKKDGKLLREMRTDGRRLVSFFDMFDSPNTPRQSPNFTPFAVISPYRNEGEWTSNLPLQSIDLLLKEPDMTVVEAPTPNRTSTLETYHLRMAKRGKLEFFVEVDPQTRRIQSLWIKGMAVKETFEYPTTIDEKIFDPHLQVQRDIPVYDAEAQTAEANRRIKTGLGRQGPITLRLVTMDYLGNLWAFWTGAMPDSDLRRPVRFPGVPTGPAFGLKEFTTGYPQVARARPAPSIGQWLGAMGRPTSGKVGDTVDVEIPYDKGTVHFRRVPVMRIGLIYSLEKALGTRRVGEF